MSVAYARKPALMVKRGDKLDRFELRLSEGQAARWQAAVQGTAARSVSAWIRDLVDSALDIAEDLNNPDTGGQVRLENYMKFLEVVERLKRPGP